MAESVEEFHQNLQHRSHFFRNCFLGCFGFILLIALSIGWVLARSGLATIPVLSAWSYHPPTPRATVSVPDGQLDDFNERLKEIAGTRTTTDVSLTLTEADLNALIRSDNPDTTITLRTGGIEWFGPIQLEKVTLFVTIQAVPYAEAGHLRIKVTSCKLGQLGLPAGLLTAAAGVFQEKFIDTNELIKQIRFDEISVMDDGLFLKGSIPLDLGGGPEGKTDQRER